MRLRTVAERLRVPVGTVELHALSTRVKNYPRALWRRPYRVSPFFFVFFNRTG